jgi:hypothetical protein
MVVIIVSDLGFPRWLIWLAFAMYTQNFSFTSVAAGEDLLGGTLVVVTVCTPTHFGKSGIQTRLV